MGLSLEPFIDEVAKQIAAKVSAELASRPLSKVQPRLLTLEQSATYIGRSLAAIQHMIADRQIPTVRSDRRVFIDIRDLDKWIDDNKEEGR